VRNAETQVEQRDAGFGHGGDHGDHKATAVANGRPTPAGAPDRSCISSARSRRHSRCLARPANRAGRRSSARSRRRRSPETRGRRGSGDPARGHPPPASSTSRRCRASPSSAPRRRTIEQRCMVPRSSTSRPAEAVGERALERGGNVVANANAGRGPSAAFSNCVRRPRPREGQRRERPPQVLPRTRRPRGGRALVFAGAGGGTGGNDRGSRVARNQKRSR